jgi:hypothetical protein
MEPITVPAKAAERRLPGVISGIAFPDWEGPHDMICGTRVVYGKL